MRLLSLIPLPEQVSELFRGAFDFVEYQDGKPIERIWAAEPDAILCSTRATRFDAQQIDALPPSVVAIATYSVGHDHLDLAAAVARGLAVFNTPEVLADSVADNAMLLLLGAARRATESINLVRSGLWLGWSPTQLNGTELKDKALGIMGFGAIGTRIARRARSFGMHVSYTSRKPAQQEEGAVFVSDPRELLANSDVFVLACPSTSETRRFIDANTLSRARASLILVNVGRGDLVDDDALIAALAGGGISSAGLDVFHDEPNFDHRYLDLPNVFMLPHIGSSTIEARIRMGNALTHGLLTWAAGGRPTNRIA